MRPVSEPRDFIDALRRVTTAARVADLDGLDLRKEIATLAAIADRVEGVAVEEPRMQASLTSADLTERYAMAMVAGQEGRAERAHDIAMRALREAPNEVAETPFGSTFVDRAIATCAAASSTATPRERLR